MFLYVLLIISIANNYNVLDVHTVCEYRHKLSNITIKVRSLVYIIISILLLFAIHMYSSKFIWNWLGHYCVSLFHISHWLNCQSCSITDSALGRSVQYQWHSKDNRECIVQNWAGQMTRSIIFNNSTVELPRNTRWKHLCYTDGNLLNME